MFLANSIGQPLAAHCALVGLLSRHIVASLYPAKPALRASALHAGLLHDVGKIDPCYASYVSAGDLTSPLDEDGCHQSHKDFTFDAHPRHNEVSWWMAESFFMSDQSGAMGNAANWQAAKYAIFWHHAKPLRSSEGEARFGNLSNIAWLLEPSLEVLRASFRDLWEEINRLAGVDSPLLLSSSPTDDAKPTPAFKERYANFINLEAEQQLEKSLNLEAARSAIRSAVVSADRVVSAMSVEELHYWLDEARQRQRFPSMPWEEAGRGNRVIDQIAAMRERFEEATPGSQRNVQQARAAARLAQESQSILKGPAGCGKTKIFLEYIEQTATPRTFVLVPRVTVGLSLFHELVTEYGITDGVELYTGEQKLISPSDGSHFRETADKEAFSGNIVITTVDQVCSLALSHRRINLLTEIMSSNLIVDEFHEIFDIPGISLMFLEIMRLREWMGERTAKTLLISATPNRFMVERMGSAERLDDPHVEVVPSFNAQPFHIELRSQAGISEAHPYSSLRNKGMIAIANSAVRAQISAIQAALEGADILCFHSKFSRSERTSVFERVMSEFGKARGQSQCVLFSGPIVQASLNITTTEMHTEICTAENWFQRLGRLNRFADFDSSSYTTHCDRDKCGEPAVIQRQVLEKQNAAARTTAWLNFLAGLERARRWTLAELYAEYDRFHELDSTAVAYASDFQKILKASAAAFARCSFDPVQLPASILERSKKAPLRVSKNSLRGSSCFVLPWVWDLSAAEASQKWLYDDDSPDGDTMSEDVEQVRALGADIDGESGTTLIDELLRFMRKKIREPGEQALREGLPIGLKQLFGKKKAVADAQAWWLNQARSRSTPVLVSLPSDTTFRDSERRYLKLADLPIGLISIKDMRRAFGEDLFNQRIVSADLK